MKYEKLIKDGFVRQVRPDELPPNSWQQEWDAMGNHFYEFTYKPAVSVEVREPQTSSNVVALSGHIAVAEIVETKVA